MMHEPYNRAHLEIPPNDLFLSPATDFIQSMADQYGMERERATRLTQASSKAIALVMRNNQAGRSEEPIRVDVRENQGQMLVEVLNRGVPLFPQGEELSNFSRESSGELDTFSVENRGRQGQRMILSMRLLEGPVFHSNDYQGLMRQLSTNEETEIELRELREGEETALSRLFYYVYSYDYIYDFVYYPEKIRAKLESKSLISFVAALPDGTLLGHVGLMKWNDQPTVYEPCLGVTDPAVKSKGIFGKVFHHTMERVKEIPMQYCIFDFVTNHLYSQKLVNKYHPCTMSVFVGCQTKETQAKLERLGMGEDPQETDRYTLLYSILPQVAHPFGQQVYLPINLGEMVGFLLKPLNLTWAPTSRFELLPPEGEFSVKLSADQNAVVFDLFNPGRRAVDQILKQWQDLLNDGFQYAGIEVPLDQPGVGHLYDILSDNEFFIGGFIPYHHSDRLGFRFQTIGPTNLDFDEIKVCGADAQRLLSVIRSNYERTRL